MGAIDLGSGLQTATVNAGGNAPHEVAVSADGRLAFSPIYGDSGVGKPGTDGSKIAVIDLHRHRLVSELDFGRGLRPHGIVLHARSGLLYVTTELQNSVAMIDPVSLEILGFIPTGQPESHMLALSNDGRWGYTANVGPGTVSVLDLKERRTVTVIPVADRIQRIAITPDGKTVFTSDQTAPRIAAIDTEKNRLARWITIPATGYGAAVTADGRWLVVAMISIDQVAVIDVATMTLATCVDVPASPQEVVITPNSRTAYVSCDRSGQVAELSLQDGKVTRLMNAGNMVDGLALTT